MRRLTAEEADRWLDTIYSDAHFRLNPSDDDCPHCGGEGETHECFDGCCEDAEEGCEDCVRPCQECARFQGAIAREVRVAVLQSFNVDLARAWLRHAERDRTHTMWTDDQVLRNLHAARAGCTAFSDEDRAASACWVEGML